MKKRKSLRNEVRRLKRLNEKLVQENKRLKQEVSGRLRHVQNATGFKGESFIQKLLKGSIQSVRGSEYDLKVGRKLLEIKTSECSCAIKGRKNGTGRWTWHRPFGTSGKNHYDYLVLTGDLDNRYRHRYRDQDKPASGVVMFLIQRGDVKNIMRESGEPIIQITTNPDRQRSKGGKAIWHYQVTRRELKRKFRK